jgi:lipopolysaccharide/colanic/teichoic acid biosynthesis glycosyltransferase
MLLAAPIIAASAIAIVRESGRPVFFRSIRLGRRGRPFEMLKLRTMAVGAEDSPHRDYIAHALSEGAAEPPDQGVHKITDDSRVTNVGRFLRRWSLDELPQLVNVLKGEMSLVGPRPDLEYALEYYEPQHHSRFLVLPGMTGLWQVSGRSRVSVVEMLELDLQYVEDWSLWLDLRILVRTLPAMLSKRGTGV